MQRIDDQYLIDLEEIKRLKYQFSWSLETSTPHDLADLFVEDGWIDAGPWGRMHGRDKIRKGYVRAFEDAPQWQGLHIVTNPRILIDGDEATGTWYLLDCSTRTEGPNLAVLALYHETYRRTDEGWRYVSVTLDFKWVAGTGQITEDNPVTVPDWA